MVRYDSLDMLARNPLRTVSLTLASTLTQPARGEDFFHGFLGPDDQEVDHVAGVASFVG